jgi:hypothetical protein
MEEQRLANLHPEFFLKSPVSRVVIAHNCVIHVVSIQEIDLAIGGASVAKVSPHLAFPRIYDPEREPA